MALKKKILLILSGSQNDSSVSNNELRGGRFHFRVNHSQTQLQQIIWRENTDSPLKTYQLKTVTYGTSSAPYLATRTLSRLAADEGNDFPLASKAMRDFYVDDVLTGTNTLEEATALQVELDTLLKRGGFHLRKWSSNDSRILAHVPLVDREIKSDISFQDDILRKLGLLWHPNQDSFKISVPESIGQSEQNSSTKRNVVSTLAKLFDPIGLIAPIHTKLKIYIQNLWRTNLNWVDPLPENLKKIWETYLQELSAISFINVPRFIGILSYTEIQLHGFSDASEVAYGACVYLRFTTANSTKSTSSNLLCSKSRIAPIKAVSIPRLELCAALLLTRLAKKVIGALNVVFERVVLWADSTIVLAWIKSTSSKLKSFASIRVSEIQEETKDYEWRHVPTGDNPADLISRGKFPKQLLDNDLWWHGPPWLTEGLASWPKASPSPLFTEVPELKHNFFCKTENSSVFLRFSKLLRLIRVIAYCFRFISNLRSSLKQFGVLTAEELHSAKMKCIKIIQEENFPNELFVLRQGSQAISAKSSVHNLNPMLDDQGILRVGGRLKNARTISFDQQHPILLPTNHHFTKLIARHYHEKDLHAGPQQLLAAIRTEFWPIRGRDLVRSTLHNCLICFRSKPPASSAQLMGELPVERVEPCRPFLNTGVDFCGPFWVRPRKNKKGAPFKIYIALFICQASRAIHLELVFDLTTNAFIAALKRFMSRRGMVKNIYSDNAKTFVGANNQLKEISKKIKDKDFQDSVNTFLASDGIKWHFTPPRSPHFGGSWESGVKLFKYHFKRVAGNASLTIEEMLTLTAEIEACLNSRPLTPLSNDPSDLSPLTPAHFLIGQPMTTVAEPDIRSPSSHALNRWQQLQRLLQHFWSRWSREYLGSLQQRMKWKVEERNLQVGDMVVLRDDNQPLLQWTIGRIHRIFPGNDGLVRVAEVKTAKGVAKRGITTICLLPMPPNLGAEYGR